jgi:O-antigen ligase
MNGRLALPRTDLTTAVGGMVGTALVVLFVERAGTSLGFSLMFGVTFFAAIVAAYLMVPHVAVAATIPIFAVLPALRVFVHPLVGGTKDLIVFAAVVAAAILFLQRRAARERLPVDSFALALAALIFLLYIANVGGYISGASGHGASWFHGVRLFAEPLSLLLVGLMLRQPERTFRWGAMSLAVTAVGVALIGMAQQALGVEGVLALGYEYGEEVRHAFGYLRSFGTLSEPFSYASFLLFGLAAVMLWARRALFVYLAAPILAIGLAVSFVRTAGLIAAALLGLALARRGHLRFATLLVLSAAAVAGALFVSGSQERSTRVVPVNSNIYLTLNGRTEVWQEQIGTTPSSWIFGRGVGATGTAAQRAQETLTGVEREATDADVVDSGYLATVADVGLLGLAILLALLARLVVLARRRSRRGDRAGWLALALLTVMLFDALTRESFNGFPVAYVGMLLVGLAVARPDGEPFRRAAARTRRA